MKIQPTGQTIMGSVEHVVFRSPDNSFHIYEFLPESTDRPITVRSCNTPVWTGMQLKLRGSWTNDIRYGSQFAATIEASTTPITKSGLTAYLSSGAFRKLGKVTANRLVTAFGLELPDIIQNNPKRLRELKGIPKALSQTLHEDWQKAKGTNQVDEMFLRGIGATSKQIGKLKGAYGDQAAQVIRQNPYILCTSVRGFGFHKADKLALGMGLSIAEPARIEAGLYEAMRQAKSDKGHCLLPKKELLRRSSTMLGVDMPSIEAQLMAGAPQNFNETTYKGEPAYAMSWLHTQEIRIAEVILRLASQSPPWKIADLKQALDDANNYTKKPLNSGQVQAFYGILASKISMLNGGPGTGKTTLLNALLHIITQAKMTPKLSAPTGRAAVNMINATGLDSETIHLLLKPLANGEFFHNKNNPLDCDVLVLDEMSMTDTSLFYAVISALPMHAALILVGDVNQLEPIGPGKPLADMIDSGVVNTFTLTQIQRQAANSKIIKACHSILNGQLPDIDSDPITSDCLFYRVREPEQIQQTIIDLASRGLPKLLSLDPLKDIQVLSPMNVNDLGVNALQSPLQAATIQTSNGPTYTTKWATFYISDKVVHIRNNYNLGVRNGEIGIIRDINEKDALIHAEYSGRKVTYDFDSFSELRHGYAISVHKSQGSEYPGVIIPIIKQHQFMLRRKLLITALSRARRIVVMVGHVDALATAIKSNREEVRYTKLRELLQK